MRVAEGGHWQGPSEGGSHLCTSQPTDPEAGEGHSDPERRHFRAVISDVHSFIQYMVPKPQPRARHSEQDRQ